MQRFLRYLLIWLTCTAASVTAVILTVHFVVGSTRPTPPVARSAPTVFVSPSAAASPTVRAARPAPKGTPAAVSASHRPGPTRTATKKPPTPHPGSTTTASPTATAYRQAISGSTAYCEQGGAGVQTIESDGGQATVSYGSGGVCLVSAVPTRGYTTGTEQTRRDTLTVTFTADSHRSEITATTVPQDSATVREVSW